MSKCPLSGIDCDECGYPNGCFLKDLVEALDDLRDALIMQVKTVLGENRRE